MDSIAELRDALLSGDAIRRFHAIRAAVKSPEKNVALLPDFYTLCGSDCRPIASDASAAITMFGRHAIPFLLRLMESADPKDRRNAIAFLPGKRSNFRVVKPILRDRPDSRADWGEYETEVRDRLHLALSDPDPGVRLLAAFTLDDMDEAPDDLVARLIEGLTLSDVRFQTFSAAHLGRLGRKAAAALSALRDFVQSHPGPEGGSCRPSLAAAFAIRRIEQDREDAIFES